MLEDAVTIVRCSRCHRSADVILIDGRFWCAWCQDWAEIEAERIRDATVHRGLADPLLVRASPSGWPLQPLRVTAGWYVAYNNGLYEVDPDPALVPEEDRWWAFKQDMLQMRHNATNRLLDIGWYTDGDLVGGCYGLVVHEGDFLGPELHKFTTNDRQALVVEVERLLVSIAAGEL